MLATPSRRQILRQYADLLTPLNWGWQIKAASKFASHDRRVGGLSSPALAAEETNKVIGA